MEGTPHPDSALLDDVLEYVREPIVVTTREGMVLRATRSAEVMLVAGAPLRDEPLVEFIHPDSRPAFRTTLGTVQDTAAVAVRLAPRGAEPVDAVLSFLRRDGQIVVRIESDAVVADGGLRGLEGLLENLSDAIVAVDSTLTVILANAPARRLLGVEAGEPLPGRWHAFELRQFVLALLSPDALHAEAQVELDARRSFRLTGLPTGGRDTALVIAADVTQRQLKERLEHDFVVNAAHELQTPLTAIVGLVEALTGKGIVEDETRQRFHEHLRRETDRLVRLVDALLLLARVGATDELPREPVALAPLLRQVADDLDTAPGVEVNVVAPPDVTAVAHQGLLEAVVRNVAQNAARHTTEGRIFLTARAERRGVVIEVRDTGVGMDAATRARAVERFYKGSRARGFGLGLSIAAQAAEALGGALEIDSSPGAGTTARLVLPASPG